MKRWIALLLALVMVLGMVGCGKSENAKKADELISAIGEVSLDSREAIEQARAFYDSLTDKEKEEVENAPALEQAQAQFEEMNAAYQYDLILTALTEEKWINVNNGDVYSLEKDGTGFHNDTAITYSLNDDILAIIEGVSSVQAKQFHWDRSGSIPRIIPENENVFYVRECDYDTISQQITKENINILLSQEFWKASNATAFLQFLDNGIGWVVLVGQTIGMTWEMIDNNTVRSHLDYNGGQNMELDIINDNGDYRLEAGNGTIYTPYHN